MPYETISTHFLSLRRFGLLYLRCSESSIAPNPRRSNSEAPVRSDLGRREKREGWKDVIRNCTKPGVARQWTILCFSVTGTLIVVLFALLFVEIPEGKFISAHSELTFGSKLVESEEPTSATNVSTWLSGSSQTVIPRACHSHNDYLRRIPLFTALTAGCIGVEADVWLEFDHEYTVGFVVLLEWTANNPDQKVSMANVNQNAKRSRANTPLE
ncbi:hypothetical protein F4782DRAFT_533885 [Xylaria castorea]|nr:hypothetical protein F4782DRAFT_533885 [Xylaria castorea]